MAQNTTYAREAAALPHDEERVLTPADLAALPGLIGFIARGMIAKHGCYGYTETREGQPDRRVLLRLA